MPSCTTGWCWEYSVPPKMDYRAIRGTGHDNIWIVGGPQYKVILQWNGEVWTVHKHSAPGSLNGVWGSDTKSAWAVGDAGTLVEWDGSTWTPRSLGVSVDLYAIWGASSTDVWIAGEHGTILRKRR
ncbi:MAG: hypothetical protein U1A78_40755 [Polyangia bacterium]